MRLIILAECFADCEPVVGRSYRINSFICEMTDERLNPFRERRPAHGAALDAHSKRSSRLVSTRRASNSVPFRDPSGVTLICAVTLPGRSSSEVSSAAAATADEVCIGSSRFVQRAPHRGRPIKLLARNERVRHWRRLRRGQKLELSSGGAKSNKKEEIGRLTRC